MLKRKFIAKGHLIDSGILANILNLIVREEADYKIIDFNIGKTNAGVSNLQIELIAKDEAQLSTVSSKLINQGCFEEKVPEAKFIESLKDKCVDPDFYSTTNHKTKVFYSGKWVEVQNQRMDGVIVLNSSVPVCKKLRDVKKGDPILVSSESIRLYPPQRDRESNSFSFMSGEVSSERSADVTVKGIAEELLRYKKEGEKVVVVAGPVVVHTGGASALSALIREGFVGGFLGGNAIAVHDIESVFYGTSLGVCQKTGLPANEGHKNHMRAINRINTHGSIAAAVEAGDLNRGIIYELIKAKIPYSLAGSIRDDGPLPETEADMIKAQNQYAEIIKDASMVIMLSSMLHSIGTGNMMPSWVKTVCVDINPAVVTKLADRGSSQAIGIVSDVGLFLKALTSRCIPGFE